MDLIKRFFKRKLLKFIIYCIRKYYSEGIIDSFNPSIVTFLWTKELEEQIK